MKNKRSRRAAKCNWFRSLCGASIRERSSSKDRYDCVPKSTRYKDKWAVALWADILYGVNAIKSKKIKEQERCETLDKNCVEIKKDVNQSSPQRISGDKSNKHKY